MKTCRKCQKAAPAAEFPANKRTRDGLTSWCRECHYAATKAWGERNPEATERYSAKRRIRHELRTCEECGGEFVPARKDSRRCAWCRGTRRKPTSPPDLPWRGAA